MMQFHVVFQVFTLVQAQVNEILTDLLFKMKTIVMKKRTENIDLNMS